MIGYWFKSSILSFLLFLIPVISFGQTNLYFEQTKPRKFPPNTNIYTLNITCSNAITRSIHVEKQLITNSFPVDISYLVNSNTNRPHFAVQFTFDEIDVGYYSINAQVYKNNILISNYDYQGQSFDTRDTTNRVRSINLFLIDK
jgi:hypothetical protein